MTPTTLWEHSHTFWTLLGPNWLRGPWPFLLYKMLYNGHASPRGPCVAIQLYSAIHYTGIHRYTLYNLCNTPLRAARDRFVGATPVARVSQRVGRPWGQRPSVLLARKAESSGRPHSDIKGRQGAVLRGWSRCARTCTHTCLHGRVPRATPRSR